uniref:Uncharacterized protein n=1 Tax=Lotharella vacuolata TaxID=74820 RepID=A0A0H5BL06_9EUKA|nr:hypothetical protein [Lotharella vacuolata]
MNNSICLRSTKKKRFRFINCEICNQVDHFTRNCKSGIFNWGNIFGKNTFKVFNYQNVNLRKSRDYGENQVVKNSIKMLKKINNDLNFKTNKNFLKVFVLSYIY